MSEFLLKERQQQQLLLRLLGGGVVDSKSNASSDWSCLGIDLTELILSYLPIRSIIRARTVCKLWNSVITHHSFLTTLSASKKPWFFLYGQNNIFLKHNQAFGFDPESNEWIRLPPALFPPPRQDDSFIGGSDGFFFLTATSSKSLLYSPVNAMQNSWRETAPLRFSRCNPLVGVFEKHQHQHQHRHPGGSLQFIVVGGARFVGGLVDIEERLLAVEIYDCDTDSWELCPPLPADFRPGNSSQWLSSALLKRKFYVFGIYSGFVSAFDLDQRKWNGVRTLRPPGALFCFLVSSRGDELILAGLCSNTHQSEGGLSFNLWRVDDDDDDDEESSMVFSEVAVMPQHLLYSLFDGGEEEEDTITTKFASLKCVGLDGLVYVFNEEHHMGYSACVCEIKTERGGASAGAGSSKCVWWKVPELPPSLNRFHKVVSFCSKVSMRNVLGGGVNSIIAFNNKNELGR